MNINRLGTLRQFQILLEVYKLSSISKAAVSLGLTQPTVSMQLKKLADQHDIQLYNQIGKRLVFSDAGIMLVNSAKIIVHELETLHSNMSQMHGLTRGTLNLSVVTSAKYFIPHLIGPFCQRYPNIDVQLNVGNREQAVNRLKNGEDDLYVFSHIPNVENIEAIRFAPNPLIPIVSTNNPLARKAKVSLSELLKLDFLVREPGSGTRFAIDQHFKEHKVNKKIRMTIESNEAIRHCVMEDLGFSILSEHALSYGGDEGVKRLTIEDFPILSQWSFVWSSTMSFSPIARVFLEYIRTEGLTLLPKLS
ncbi:LysR family transcriptional regulator [Reinekea sp.]|jgi:DNA-binding transcriptional LysR family regulator|uniref:LysR family transcriptional regulator n=1 Tax=Reinekea sp. TaxID=1970455 RepID=UPI003988B2B5